MKTGNGRRHGMVALAIATVLLAGGCGGATTDGTEPAPGTSSKAAEKFTPATDGELNLYTWSDYIPQDLVDRFSEETGIDMKVSYYDSNETLEAKLRATGGTGYDLVVPSDYMVAALIKQNLLQRMDLSALPNGGNVKSEFLDVYFDKGRQYSVPYLYGTTGFAYDSSVVTSKPSSWKDFFEGPDEVAGKIGIFNDQVEGVTAALRAVGGEPCTTDPEKLQAAQDLLVSFKKDVATISSEGNIDRMASGENPMAMMWNGATHRVKETKPTVVYVYPTEGATLWQDNFAIPSGAENVQQALTFLNWFMQPENAAEAANAQGYNSGITGVDELLDDSMKSDPAVVIPEADLSKVAPVPPCDAEATNNYSKIWEKFKS